MALQTKPQNFAPRTRRRLCVMLTLTALATASPASAQTLGKAPSLTMAAVPLTTAQRASQTMVNLNFRIPAGYHINSNTPKSEFLIPTALKMDLPTDIILGKIEYPAGEDRNFPFSPDEKLSVYSGDFTIAVASASAALRRARKIRDARRAALPGLRQRRLLSAENVAREF